MGCLLYLTPLTQDRFFCHLLDTCVLARTQKNVQCEKTNFHNIIEHVFDLSLISPMLPIAAAWLFFLSFFFSKHYQPKYHLCQ